MFHQIQVSIYAKTEKLTDVIDFVNSKTFLPSTLEQDLHKSTKELQTIIRNLIADVVIKLKHIFKKKT